MIEFLKKNNTLFSQNYLITLDQLLDNQPAILVCSDFFKKTKEYFYLTNLLKNKCKYKVLESVPSNPSLDFIEKILNDEKDYNFKNIIAVGGGSVIDVSKILKISNLFDTKKFLMVIPSTAGTGSELTHFATAWDYRNHKKLSYENYNMKPDLIIFNPRILNSHDFKGILFPVLDSISHCLESIWNKNRTIDSENIALRVLRNYLELLPNIHTNQSYHFHKKLQWNSFLAGYIISQTKTSIAHAISYPLTLKYQVPHGLACSFSLPSLIDYYKKKYQNSIHCTEIFDDISDLLQELKLRDLLGEYLSHDQLLDCLDLPLEPSRMDNYILDKNEAIKYIRLNL